MRLVEISTHGSGRDPRTGTYRSTYCVGIAHCETSDGDVQHGPFIGFTSDLETDPVVWLAWERHGDTDHTAPPSRWEGCACLDRDRQTCLGDIYRPKQDVDAGRLRPNLNLPHGHRIGVCTCGGEVRYDPDEDAEVCTLCPDPEVRWRDGARTGGAPA